jgi:hypothetical protein
MGPAHNRACGVHANIVSCSRHQPTTVLNWPEQASSTNTPRGPPLLGNHLPIHLFQHIHHIQQNQNRGTPRTNVHPSRVKTSLWPVTPRNRSKARRISRTPHHHHPLRIQWSHRANLPSTSGEKPHDKPRSTNHITNLPSHHITR